MWQTTPLKGISPRDLVKLGMRSLCSEDKIWYDRKELIEEMIEITLYASNVLSIQGWFIDQGMICSKIFYSNQITTTNNYFMSSMPKRRGDVQGFVFSFLIVDEGLQL
jgi:hypothetical protein